MNDYSESIGWCCQHSAVVYYSGADHACRCPYLHEDRNHLIPVFAVIPEGERPETHDEAHECVEVVTNNVMSLCVYRPATLGSDLMHCPDGSSVSRHINDLAEATARARR